MSRARHKKRENGGSVKQVWNAGGEQNAAKESEERKKGGKVMADGEKSKSRSDRPNRAKGGRVRGEGIGANLTPLSTAARVKHITKQEAPESGDDKVM
jgi:hypothetical protein